MAITSRSECDSQAQSAILLPVTFNERKCYLKKKRIQFEEDCHVE
jgi:hypothetical protein